MCSILKSDGSTIHRRNDMILIHVNNKNNVKNIGCGPPSPETTAHGRNPWPKAFNFHTSPMRSTYMFCNVCLSKEREPSKTKETA